MKWATPKQVLHEGNPTTAQLKRLYKKAKAVQPFWADEHVKAAVGNPDTNTGWHQLQGWERRSLADELSRVITGKGSYGGIPYSNRAYRGESLTERDADLRDLERRARAGGREEMANYRNAMNRVGRAPAGEVFFRDQAKDAAKELRLASKYLLAAAKDVDGYTTWNGSDVVASGFRAQAKACRSAASRIAKSKRIPARSHRAGSLSTRTLGKPRSTDWRDQAMAAHDAVGNATNKLRGIAFAHEQDDRSEGEKVFEMVRWLVWLGDSIGATRDPHGGYYYNDKYKRPIPS